MLKPRLTKNRRASVLIIVIVLLLLLAILGAAYISTSRGDRLSSAQSVLNAQTDFDTQGIADLVAGTIVDDLNDYVPTNGGAAVPTFSQNLRYPVYNLSTVNPSPPPANLTSTTIYRNSYLGTFNSACTYNTGDIVSPVTAANTPATFYVCNTPGTIAGPPGGGWTLTNRWPGVTAAGATVTPNGDGFQPWLADRIPVSTDSGEIWPNITQSLITPSGATAPVATSILGTLTATSTTTFESPDGTQVPAAAQYTNVVPTALTGGAGSAGAAHDPNLANDGTNVPALSVTGTSVTATVIAGDADNDGIADSLLFRIPGAYFDGLTWYAAVRIIDNNSAINVNTAFSRDNEYTLTSAGAGAAPTLTQINNYYGLFQTSVGLWELLAQLGDAATPPAQLAALNKYQYGNNQTAPNNFPLDESTPTVPGGAPNTRNDYQYITLGDALYHGLARRLANPAIDYSSAANVYYRYQALPLSDEAALASHFCLKTTNSSGMAQSLIEQLLPTVLWTNAPTVGSYDPSNVANWFSQNFSLNSGTSFARSYLVTRNPVSNYVQPVFDAINIGEPINPRMLPWGTGTNYSGGTTANYNHYKGVWVSSTNYVVNDIVAYPVKYNPAGGANAFTFAGPGSFVAPTPGYSFTYICVTPNSAQPPLSGTANANSANPMIVNTANWHLQPWTNHPVKANVNTAPFAELFRAFWCVMAGNPAAGINQPPFNNGVPYSTAANPLPVAPWDYNPYDPTATYPVGATPPTSGQSSGFRWHQFRSPLRDPTTNSGAPPSTAGNAAVVWMDPTNVAILRSAIAAVNTLGLRDQSQNVISRQVPIQVYNSTATQLSPAANIWNAEATVFSASPQPFITEVFATNDQAVGPAGYVGIELYNPYPFSMTMTNWQVAVINRLPTGAPNPYPEMAVSQLSPNPLGVANGANFAFTIPAYSYALLENLPVAGDTNTGNAGNAVSRPAAIANANLPLAGPPTSPAAYIHVYVNNLQNVMAGGPAPGASGGEFVLLRPRRADGTYTNPNQTVPVDPFNNYGEGSVSAPNYYDMVPIDSYDFTGLSQGGTVFAWSYIRQKPPFTSPPTPPTANLFLATNGGAYVGNAASGTPRQQVNAQPYPTEVEATDQPGSFTTMVPAFGLQFPTTGAATPPFPAFPPIQIYNTNTVPANSPNAIAITTSNGTVASTAPRSPPEAYPFGLFARNGDMLNIPFIGAYRIRSGNYSLAGSAASGNNPAIPGGTFTPDNPALVVEMNSLPMDCAFADDGDSALSYPPPGAAPPATADDSYENIGRFYPTTARLVTAVGAPPAPSPGLDYYFWTRRLFDYLTVQSNDNDYMPNFDPDPIDDNGSPPPQSYFAGPVTQVYNADGAAPDQTNQDNVGVEGLININTASAQVLSLLPLVTKGDDPNGWQADCTTVAGNIVTYRNQNGPFMSIYDLNKVTGFQTANGKITIGTANIPATAGAIVTPGVDNTLTSVNGLLTPPDLAFPNVTPTASNNLTEDYQSDNAVLNRISNMITTRSDTFTVYIVVEGWQNAILPGQGPPTGALPQLKVVRHYAFIADRSAINQDPSTRFLRTLTVPNN